MQDLILDAKQKTHLCHQREIAPTSGKAGLRHIHLRDATSKRWHLKYMRIFDKTSNTALVYCTGERNENHFLLLDVLENAHSYYQGGQQHILYLAELANDFRKKFQEKPWQSN